MNDLHDLRSQVDDAIYSYQVTTKGKISFYSWWKGFRASGVKPKFGVQVTKAGATYHITCSSLIVSVSKAPMIQNLTFEIAENGTVSPVQIRKLYPRAVDNGEPRPNQ